MTLQKKKKKNIIDVLKRRKVKKAGIFGSYARGDATKDSDIDIVVELAQKDLFELSGLKIDLEKTLNRKVDIVTYNGLNFSKREGFKERVLRDQVILI